MITLALTVIVRYKEGMNLRPCGHRLEEKHFAKIRSKARSWGIKEAQALRRIVEES